MTTPLQAYLRTYRKRSGLSQDDVAFLIGSANANNITRHELHSRTPDLRTAFAYEVIFRAPLEQLFAGLYQKVEKETIARARLLAHKTAQTPSRRLSRRNLPFLELLTSEPVAVSPDDLRR